MKPYQSVIAVLVLAAIFAPIAWAMEPPAWVEQEYGRCMADAIDDEMEKRVQAQREYSDAQVRDLEDYRSALASAWARTDEDDRKDAIRDADRAYRDESRQTKRDFDERIRELRNDSRIAQRACRDRQNDHEDFIEDICVSTSDCRGGQICTTERGVCDTSCPGDAQTCSQQCAGTCERTSSSRSSRSTSSRSSSRSSNGNGNGNDPWDDYQSNGQVCTSSAACPAGYFCSTNLGECNQSCAPGFDQCVQVCAGTCLLYPITPPAGGSSSSRASTGQGGVNCQPYRCADGREVPSCTADGHPIEYFQNPCYS